MKVMKNRDIDNSRAYQFKKNNRIGKAIITMEVISNHCKLTKRRRSNSIDITVATL